MFIAKGNEVLIFADLHTMCGGSSVMPVDFTL